MKILRQEGKFTLIEKIEDPSLSLRFYIDNGEELTEYFDELEKELFMYLSREDFIAECAELFFDADEIKQQFIDYMQDKWHNFQEILDFADEHFQNGLSFEENRELFLKDIGKRVHNELRGILQKFGNPEYGDVIIDEICEVFDYPTTRI